MKKVRKMTARIAMNNALKMAEIVSKEKGYNEITVDKILNGDFDSTKDKKIDNREYNDAIKSALHTFKMKS